MPTSKSAPGYMCPVDENGNIGFLVHGAITVTPSDAANLSKVSTKGIFVGVTGNVKVTLNDGSIVTFTGLLGGTFYPIIAKRIWATDTTATNILALY